MSFSVNFLLLPHTFFFSSNFEDCNAHYNLRHIQMVEDSVFPSVSIPKTEGDGPLEGWWCRNSEHQSLTDCCASTRWDEWPSLSSQSRPAQKISPQLKTKQKIDLFVHVNSSSNTPSRCKSLSYISRRFCALLKIKNHIPALSNPGILKHYDTASP
jgi:hypothetical protein